MFKILFQMISIECRGGSVDACCSLEFPFQCDASCSGHLRNTVRLEHFDHRIYLIGIPGNFQGLHELKLIVDLMYEGGIERMYYSVSDTAEYGGLSRGTRVIDTDTKKRMKSILEEVQSGAFAREWMKENRDELPNLTEMRNSLGDHKIEKVGKELRSMMEWIDVK